MSKKIFILGTSGLAREIGFLIEQINLFKAQWELVGFITERGASIGKDLGYASVVGDDDWLLEQSFAAGITVGIGFPRIKARALSNYLNFSDRFTFPNLIHPSVVMDLFRVKYGMGNSICAGTILTCDIQVGDFNLLNLNVTVGHDSIIGNYNVINPGANISGGVKVGNRVLIGTGAQILENVVVGDDAIIGAGAVVTKDVEPNTVVVGVPAKPLK